jgi:hypothetical protein
MLTVTTMSSIIFEPLLVLVKARWLITPVCEKEVGPSCGDSYYIVLLVVSVLKQRASLSRTRGLAAIRCSRRLLRRAGWLFSAIPSVQPGPL